MTRSESMCEMCDTGKPVFVLPLLKGISSFNVSKLQERIDGIERFDQATKSNRTARIGSGTHSVDLLEYLCVTHFCEAKDYSIMT